MYSFYLSLFSSLVLFLQQFTQPAVIEQMAYVLIACGALMFFLSFLGYCGAIRESPCLLTTVIIIIIITIIIPSQMKYF